MKAVIAHGADDLRVEDLPDAPAPGNGEVTVAIKQGGICGSDLHYFHHGGFGTVRLKEPMVLGHEVSGTVVAKGEGVENIGIGTNVAVNPSMPCGHCSYCQKGQRNLCQNMSFFGSAMRFPHTQGLFRQFITLPAAQAIPVRPETDLVLAACAEPFAVCLHAVNQVGALLGRRVLVSGCGPIGCLTVVASRLAGATEVEVVDLASEPLAIATKLGASVLHDLSLDPLSLDALSENRGVFDVVFECSGSAQAIASAFKMVRPGGTIVQVGMGNEATVPLSLAVPKEVHLIGSFRFDAEFALAVQLIDSGAVDLRPLITTSLPIDQATAAFNLASDRRKAMKVQITVG